VIDRGWEILRDGIAPVPATTASVLLAVVSVWMMATLADALAFSADASIGALVPSLIVVIIAVSLGPDGTSLWTTAPYLVAALVFLACCHRDLLARRRAWFTASGRAPFGTRAGVGIALGAAALAIGLVVAPALPGAEGDALLDYKRGRGGGGYRSSVNPLVDVKARIAEQGNVELFTVQSSSAQKWRLVALDRFTGEQWGVEATSRAAGDVLPRSAPGLDQVFTITGLDDRWLPAAFEPVATTLREARVIPESTTLLHTDDAVVGLSYRVTSRPVSDELTPEQNERTTAPLPDEIARYTALPDELSPLARRTARQATADATTPYETARALEQFFLTRGFEYSLDVPPESGNDAITTFLEDRRGFCQQFAGTFGAMARFLGLPTRLAVGFNAGRYDEDAGVYRVSGVNAHTWPEVWFADVGWTPFEPTPGYAQPGLAAGAAPETSPTAPSTAPPATPTTPTTSAAPAPGSERTVSTETGSDNGPASRIPAVLLVGLVVIVVALVGWRLVAVVRARARRSARRHGPRRAAVVGAWSEAVARLRERGLPVSDARTPREVVRATVEHPDPPAGLAQPLDRLARATTEALWSATDPAPDDVERAWEDLESLERALRAQTPWTTRSWQALTRDPDVGPARERADAHPS
jgi:transglutaminase-like putative cysteine protease